MGEDLTYPTGPEVRAIHADIVRDQPDSEPGVRTPEAVDGAIETVSVGHFGRAPETVHETAAELIRRLVAEHPFVDGNKRTALNTAVVLYESNGLALPYEDERVRTTLKRFGVNAGAVDLADVTAYLRTTATPLSEAADDSTSGERRTLLARIEETTGETRLGAVRRLAALDRERNAETYRRLATE
jgi:death-on-curing protein